jgi:hypothetical protein
MNIFKEIKEKHPNIFEYQDIKPNPFSSLKFNLKSAFMNNKLAALSFLTDVKNWILYKIGKPKKRLYLCSFGCGEGWWPLVREVCQRLDETGGKIHQVKEKFGGLRIYAHCNEEVSKLINEAEAKSYQICEECGSEEDVTSEGGWIKTLCKQCREGEDGAEEN